MVDKDAHDLYRLLVDIPTERRATALGRLGHEELAGSTTRQAFWLLADLFVIGAEAPGS